MSQERFIFLSKEEQSGQPNQKLTQFLSLVQSTFLNFGWETRTHFFTAVGYWTKTETMLSLSYRKQVPIGCEPGKNIDETESFKLLFMSFPVCIASRKLITTLRYLLPHLTAPPIQLTTVPVPLGRHHWYPGLLSGKPKKEKSTAFFFNFLTVRYS